MFRFIQFSSCHARKVNVRNWKHKLSQWGVFIICGRMGGGHMVTLFFWGGRGDKKAPSVRPPKTRPCALRNHLNPLWLRARRHEHPQHAALTRATRTGAPRPNRENVRRNAASPPDIFHAGGQGGSFGRRFPPLGLRPARRRWPSRGTGAGEQMAEQQPKTELDAPGAGRSRTGRAAALARLLHHECTRLLQLYVSYEGGVQRRWDTLPFPLLVASTRACWPLATC